MYNLICKILLKEKILKHPQFTKLKNLFLYFYLTYLFFTKLLEKHYCYFHNKQITVFKINSYVTFIIRIFVKFFL